MPHHARWVVGAAAVVVLIGASGSAPADQQPGGGPELTIEGGPVRVQIGPGGALVVGDLSGGPGGLLTAEHGLWRLVFDDRSTLDAAAFPGPGRSVRVESGAEAQQAVVVFESVEAVVRVELAGHDGGVDLTATVQPQGGKTVLEFLVPGRLRFDPQAIRQVIAPLHPHYGVGGAFLPAFYERQPVEGATSWESVTTGPGAYNRLVGAPVGMLDMTAPPVKPKATADGRAWLGPELASRLESLAVDACRPSPREKSDLVLLDTPGGPLLASQRLGATGPASGALWRWGGFVRSRDEQTAVLEATTALARRVALQEPPADRGDARRIGWIELPGGPDVSAFRTRLEAIARNAKQPAEAIRSPQALLAALQSQSFRLIVNPGGERLPVIGDERSPQVDQMVEAIGAFVRGGGHWFETGGYPFHASLVPQLYLSYNHPYPPVFADFVSIEPAAMSPSPSQALAIYRVQPRTWSPWAGASDPAALFVPGRIAHGGDAQGGYAERAFGTHVSSGATWTAPPVRIAAGRSVDDHLADYAAANGLTRRLSEKMPAELLDRLRQSVLVKVNADAATTTHALGRLPVPTLIHQSNYLKGGFDKEYPDHLPPHPQYGTPEAMKRLFVEARQAGHLMMPYTNPTWWCDHPRGPTFVAAGEAPLLRGLDGQPVHEVYGSNDGWTTTPWHPAVRAANAQTRRQFLEDYPVDILFQDQCGARTWRYDTNPASPTPWAYAEGLISQIEEDASLVPLGTEDGFDRVLNAESMLCGFTFGLVPGRSNPAWARSLNTVYPPRTWRLYPLVQALAHDKAVLLHHDLGKFVTDRPTMAWTLALGFNMSGVIDSRGLNARGPLEWLTWLDRVQKSVCGRWTGEPLKEFEQQRGTGPGAEDGVVRAQYGDVSLVANLTDQPQEVTWQGERLSLPGWGWLAAAPGLAVGDEGESAYVVELRTSDEKANANASNVVAEVWWLGKAGANEVGARLPAELREKRAVQVRFDAEGPVVSRPVRNGRFTVTLPAELPARPEGRFPAGGEPARDILAIWPAEIAL